MLTATIHTHPKLVCEQQPVLADKLRATLYVDDLLLGAESIEEAAWLYKTAIDVMKNAGMTSRKWAKNNEELQLQFGNNEPKFIPEGKILPPSQITKVLGMIWDNRDDCFMYTVESLLEFLTANLDYKRFIPKAASRVSDPLGVIAPFVLMAKLLFQKLWILGMSYPQRWSTNGTLRRRISCRCAL